MDKEPKELTAADEDDMLVKARGYLAKLEKLYPEARQIDLVNAFLRAFTYRGI